MTSSFTTSVLQMKATSGTHRVKICGDSLTGPFKSDGIIQCGKFTVGEYHWAILYHPNGISRYTIPYMDNPLDNYIGFDVQLLSEPKENVKVLLCFSLVDQNGIASNHNTRSMVYNYSKKGNKMGFDGFMNIGSLIKSCFFKDNSFTVEYSLQILETSIEESA